MTIICTTSGNTMNMSLLALVGTFSAVLFIGTIVATPLVVLAIPHDYFIRKKARTRYKHPIIALVVLIIKNVAGLVFLLAGLIMLITPGQGILTILGGLLLLNFPGKKKLELTIVSRPTIYKAISWIRARGGKPPVLLPNF